MPFILRGPLFDLLKKKVKTLCPLCALCETKKPPCPLCEIKNLCVLCALCVKLKSLFFINLEN
jgi:hypothetical protein